MLALCSLVGRLAGGWAAARTSMRGVAVVCMVVQGGALLWLAEGESRAQILLATAVFGFTVGNVLMLHPLLLAERFGVRDYGRIYPRSNLVVTLGIAGGPAAIGLLYEVLGGYGAAFALAAGISLLGAAVLAASGPTRPGPLPSA